MQVCGTLVKDMDLLESARVCAVRTMWGCQRCVVPVDHWILTTINIQRTSLFLSGVRFWIMLADFSSKYSKHPNTVTSCVITKENIRDNAIDRCITSIS